MRELRIIDFEPENEDDISEEEVKTFISDAIFLVSRYGLVYDISDVRSVNYRHRGACIFFNNMEYTWCYNIHYKIIEIKK